jgi:UDP-N-acetylglucosamine 1-carboxyvinyltransferase
MDCMRIIGGIPLEGKLAINGAKNAALPLMAASLLSDKDLCLRNIPLVMDVHSMKLLLEDMGATVHCEHKDFKINTSALHSHRAHYDFVRKMRASILVLGALLGRFGQAEVSLPGGCAIGPRPVDHHLQGLKALGAHIELDQGYIIAHSPSGRLPGGCYQFIQKTVTGTQNLIFAAVLAKGESCLKNIALEPEVMDLIVCLKKMGARIEHSKNAALYIQGCDTLNFAEHTVMPDRIEMGTYFIAAAITQGNLIIENADLSLLPFMHELANTIGMRIQDLGNHTVHIAMHDRPMPFHICTRPFPGFPTDLQAQFMALATLAQGYSYITESIFDNRFMHVCELIRMGADIEIRGNCAIVQGKTFLKGAQVMATDLRASVSLILAALAAKGETIVHRIYHLDRGYEHIETTLKNCGAHIQRLKSPPDEMVAAIGA